MATGRGKGVNEEPSHSSAQIDIPPHTPIFRRNVYKRDKDGEGTNRDISQQGESDDEDDSKQLRGNNSYQHLLVFLAGDLPTHTTLQILAVTIGTLLFSLLFSLHMGIVADLMTFCKQTFGLLLGVAVGSTVGTYLAAWIASDSAKHFFWRPSTTISRVNE